MNRDISSIRRDYLFEDLLEADVPADPMPLFDAWLDKAIDSSQEDATAMVLSTVDSLNHPHARVVLLKQHSASGFAFFTNYDSNKGVQLAANNHACLTFFWPALSRQVRIEGRVVKLSREDSEHYFASRPKGSQLAASVSPQSRAIDRDALQQSFNSLQEQYKDTAMVCPAHWGGYRLEANYIEFWQGRPSRLHDRLSYQKQDDAWTLQRMAP